jgi:putative transposase
MSVIIPNLCQECHKHHHTTFVKACRLCSDLQFPEQTLCNLVREAMRDEDSFECHAFHPNLSVVSRDDTEPSQTEDSSEDTEGISPKEKWFKAYAVQQLRINPNQIYAKIRYHAVFSTVQRVKLFAKRDFDRLDEIIHQSVLSFENTQVHLMCLAPDHMHLYIDASPNYAPNEIIHAVIEYSEREIVAQFSGLQKSSNSLWEKAYFLEGIG